MGTTGLRGGAPRTAAQCCARSRTAGERAYEPGSAGTGPSTFHARPMRIEVLAAELRRCEAEGLVPM
ncbi:hypothetical protein ABZ630_28915, partial [Streptomyces albidoflavus]|uniref:hypothetical protein n=1 Tax=Streptomyces albidoflavus TaxID=1886 RepID=UPI0033DCA1EB